MLSDSQKLALAYLNTVPFATPADIGYAMTPTRTPALRPQGAGRIGGSMAKRLIKMGMVDDVSFRYAGFPRYEISGAGRTAIEEAGGG